jgi:protein phosphatase PTC7
MFRCQLLLRNKGCAKSARLVFSVAGVSCVPDPPKLKRGGEDAFFISMDRRGMGVTDGVGGWANDGVNPAIYARDLMRSTNQVLELEKAQGKRSSTAKDVLEAGFLLTQMHRIVGSCTAVCATIRDDATLSICHVGDSGALVLAPPAGDEISVVHRTEEQQYSFNFPYQLGTGSDSSPKKTGGLYELESVPLGSVVLLYSDGVSDNVPMEELVDIVKRVYKESAAAPVGHRGMRECDLQALNCVEAARRIARVAFNHGQDRSYLSPFSIGASEAGRRYRGGKPDDITIVVGQIFPEDYCVEDTGYDTTDRFVDTLDFEVELENASKPLDA